MNKLLSLILIIFILIVGVLSFLNILSSETPRLQIISGLIFVFYAIISLILIKYFLQDEKYLEKEIHNQIEGLELSKQKSKDKISLLEQDAKQLEENLEEKEQWYDMTVKRELEMIELKKKLKNED